MHVIITHLNLKRGQYVELTGSIPEVCTDFVVNLGLNLENLLLHFNPRFNVHGCTRKIVCSSVINNVWGEPVTTDIFPFNPGAETTFTIKYEKEKLIISLPSAGVLLPFPVRVPLKVIPLMFFKNFRLKRLKIA
ncbi:galectin-1-like [Pyxicephalus adspersus]|uniref:galectin-1-like n=1 Tax=Pyxicephalus adspersus TaxID=30357 RepID=UPI003B5BF20D